MFPPGRSTVVRGSNCRIPITNFFENFPEVKVRKQFPTFDNRTESDPNAQIFLLCFAITILGLGL